MFKRLFIIVIIFMLMFPGAGFAFSSDGDILFRDSLYGAAIGGLLGLAFYLGDDDDFGKKLGTGVLIGTVGGLIYGFMETDSLVEIKKDEIKFAVPTPVIEKKSSGIQYSTSLLKAKF